MELCEKCAALPQRMDGLPDAGKMEHLTPEKRLGESTPHFPKKYVRECPTCGARWGVAHVSSWDSKWVFLDSEKA